MVGVARTYREQSPIPDFQVVTPLTASGVPAAPPSEWFDNPGLEAPTPLTVTSDGRVFGHLAAWGTRHIGMPGHVTPPRSRTGYSYFKTGVVATADGRDVPVGQITLSGGHAPLSADAGAAARHYDETGSAFADVNVGEDRHGIWMAGALRPGVTPEQMRVIRASAPSGDWRPIGTGLELVAACQVNVPGFPIARARVASGQMLALVAAGAQDMMIRRYREADLDLVSRVDELEAVIIAAGLGLSEEARASAADRGEAMPDGSFPIRNKVELGKAVKAYGRAKDPGKAKRHIIKRARDLKAVDALPQEWGVTASASIEERYASELRRRAHS